MSENVNLKQIERKAWTSFFQDGLWDILLGLSLLLLGIPDLFPRSFTSELRQNAAYVVFAALDLLIFWAGKRFVSVPRMGRVKFGAARKAKQTKAAVIYGISVVAGVIALLTIMLGLSSSPPAWVQWLGVRGFLALGFGT